MSEKKQGVRAQTTACMFHHGGAQLLAVACDSCQAANRIPVSSLLPVFEAYR